MTAYFWEPEKKDIGNWLKSCGIDQENHGAPPEEAIEAFKGKISYIQRGGFFREDNDRDTRNPSETARKTVPWRMALIKAFKKENPVLSRADLEKLEKTEKVLNTYALSPEGADFRESFCATLSSTGYAAIETGSFFHSDALLIFQKSGKYALQVLNRHLTVSPIQDERFVESIPKDKASLAASYAERENLMRFIRYDRKLESVLNLPPGVHEDNILEHLSDDFYQDISQYWNAVRHFIGGKKLTANNAYFFMKDGSSPKDIFALLQKITGLPQSYDPQQISQSISNMNKEGELIAIPTLLVKNEIELLDTGNPDEFVDQTNTPQRGDGCFNRTNDYVMEGVMGTRLFSNFQQFVRDLAKPVFDTTFNEENIIIGNESFPTRVVKEKELWKGGWEQA